MKNLLHPNADFKADNLPRRADQRPRTSNRVPHVQSDQLPPEGIVQELLQGISQLAHVRERESRMALLGVKAFWIPDEDAGGPPSAFIDDHEFCHLHTNGTIHLTVPPPLRDVLIERGWAEQHIMAKAGLISETIILVYAPRSELEVELVMWIVRKSFGFATGTNWVGPA